MTLYASVAELRQYLPQVPEDGVQLVTITGATGGVLALGYEGEQTAPIAYPATATAVQTALRAIPAIGSGGVNVRGRPGGPYTATFQGTLATDAGPLTADASGLTPSGVAIIAPANDALLLSCLTRAGDIVRAAIAAAIGDDAFDYLAYETAGTRIVRGVDGTALELPPHRIGSVAAVAYQSGTSPLAYAPFDASEWSEDATGRLYRAGGWGAYGSAFFGGAVWGSWGGGVGGDGPRYQITADWGYGPDVPPAIAELTIELAVNIWRSRDKGGFSEMVGVEGQGAIRAVAGLNKLQQQIIDDLAQPLRRIVL